MLMAQRESTKSAAGCNGLAREWKIPVEDLPKTNKTGPMVDFAEKHDVSLDWLLCGDLKDLQRMMRERKLRPDQALKVERIMEKYHRLPPEMQKILRGRLIGYWIGSHDAPAPIAQEA